MKVVILAAATTSNLGAAWPAVCTLLAIILLLIFIIRFKLNAFVALLVVSLALGLGAGLPPTQVLADMGKGVGEIMRGVAVILALGAMLGRMLDASGAAEVIARTLIGAFGIRRASLAVLIASYLVGIPVLFNVAFLLLIPIMWRLQRDTGQSLLWYALPLTFSLGVTHSLVPPHPGIVGAVQAMVPRDDGQIMVQTIIFGTLMGIPLVLIGWLIPGRLWARSQFVTVPEHLAGPPATEVAHQAAPPSFALSLSIVVLPLVLCLAGFGAQLVEKHLPESWTQTRVYSIVEDWPALYIHSPLEWCKFFGKPEMALMVSTGLAFYLLGRKRGMNSDRLAKIAGDSLQDVGGILFLFGAAGAFMEVIKATGAGDYIGTAFVSLPLTPVLVCFIVAMLMRIALGSATASILIASGLMKKFASQYPGHETLLILAVANGVTFMTQPADSGFWMVKEYCNLSVRDVMLRFNACRITMALSGLGLLLIVERWI